ncbi:MAG: glycosyltransferase [Crocinitomicaceae bacterium]
MTKKVFILAPYPTGEAPSQRFRFEQYVGELSTQNLAIEIHPFLNDKTWGKLYKQGSFFGKAFGILGSFWRRFLLLFRLIKADYIFIHREAAMIGPPVFEWIIAKILRKKYIFDFDDAIWLPNYSESNAKFHRLKAYWKTKWIIKWAGNVTAGNEYLKNYAEQYNKKVQIIPTTIDLVNVHNKKTDYNSSKITIGWTGTHTTMHYLNEIIPVLKSLENEYSFTFTVISNLPPIYGLESLQFVKWNKETEIEDLAKFSIGIMPLIDNQWAEGKCGFKGLQYMALGIPAILSPVGVNTSIIQDGVNGFLCSTAEEWKSQLIALFESKELCQKIGYEGYKTIVDRYSVEANLPHYKQLFQS